jgi:prepilin-type N-terminal cleavage/methylation domain-containing protein
MRTRDIKSSICNLRFVRRSGFFQYQIANRPGFTLVELLVSMGILALMGVLMLSFMNAAMRGWRVAEAGRQIYTKADAVMDVLDEDIGSAFTIEPSGTDSVMAFMVCERLGDNSPMLYFTRTIEAGPERRYLANAGEGGDQGREFNGVAVDNLRTLGGLMEVVYFWDSKGERLMRAFNAPPTRRLQLDRDALARPVAEGVIFFDLRFWDRWTASWEGADPYRWDRSNDQAVALPVWDSTRDSPRESDNPLMVFRNYYVPGSYNDPGDDVFPEKIRLTIVVDADQHVRPMQLLRDAVSEAEGLLRLDSGAGIPGPKDVYPFVYADGEWMRVTEKMDRGVIKVKRGVRGTIPVPHKSRAEVRVGETFVREFFLPGFRRDYLQDMKRKR